MREVVIVSAVRSAVARGKRDGSLYSTHPVELSAQVMLGAIAKAGIDPASIDDVVWGCAMPEASQGLNVARLSALKAGLPVEVPAQTVNRFCSSGVQTIASGAMQIMSGMADVVLAGGVEMMSQVPMSGYHARLAHERVESYIGMGFTAENVAERWKVSREDQDEWAFNSQQKAARAVAAGTFDAETHPVTVKRATWDGAKKSESEVQFAREELPRAETTREGLAKLKPAFKARGTVTAGNASPYSDGAAALVLMSGDRAKELGLTPLARFVTYAVAGVDPDIMGVGPIKAVPKALKQAGMTMGDLSLIEFNEAFAAQVVAVVRDLDMPVDKVNVNGGAIALGHPLGATGAKLTTQLIHELGRRGGGKGLVTMCIGGGMGAAGIFEVYGR
ncbi:MAG: acetyl-CoA acetyltransferase [Gemmatimonadetes bacterium]|nr:acetyl-CoA acetyltransferase [Gemmatimonadota bacterium]